MKLKLSLLLKWAVPVLTAASNILEHLDENETGVDDTVARALKEARDAIRAFLDATPQ